MLKKTYSRILKNFFFIFFLFFFLIILYIFSKSNLNIKKTVDVLKNCNELNYANSNELNQKNFKSFNLELYIPNQRKWKKILYENQISREQNGHYLNKNSIDANFIINLKTSLKCNLEARIRPHGDLTDHHVKFEEGNRFIHELPSLNVRLKNGHIFGITNLKCKNINEDQMSSSIGFGSNINIIRFNDI